MGRRARGLVVRRLVSKPGPSRQPTGPSRSEPPPHGAPSGGEAGRRSLLRERNFRLYFFGQLVSNTGTQLQSVAQGVLVMALTHRSVMVGVTQAAVFLPILALSLQGGR